MPTGEGVSFIAGMVYKLATCSGQQVGVDHTQLSTSTDKFPDTKAQLCNEIRTCAPVI